MRKTVLLAFILTVICISGVSGQILTPVKWEFASKKISDTEAVVFLKAKMNAGWHIYSQTVGEGGPIKTTFTFSPSNDFTLVGKTNEPKPKTKHEEVFKMDVAYFDKEVVFQQKVKLAKGQAVVKGTVEFMACDATQCLPPDEVDFAIQIK